MANTFSHIIYCIQRLRIIQNTKVRSLQEKTSHMVLSTSNVQRVIGLFDVKAIPKCNKYNVDIKSSIHDSHVHQALFKAIIFALCNRVIGSFF